MHRDGHIGLTLLIMSVLLLPFGVSVEGVIFISVASTLSVLPDLDQKLEMKHRMYTHTLVGAIIFGLIIGFFFSLGGNLQLAVIGFLAAFVGTLTHMLGDMVAGVRQDGRPWGIRVLWPVSSKEVGFGWFKSGDKMMNRSLLFVGILALTGYLISPTVL